MRYWPTIFRVTGVAALEGAFQAEIEIAIDYLVSRDDVFEYIIRPAGWTPRWHPKTFETLNAYDAESVRTQVCAPTLKVLEGGQGRELRAEILVSYRGTFEERFELQSFPFDVQPLHVKLHVEQESGVEMEMKDEDTIEDDLTLRLRKKWGNTEWNFLDLRAQYAHKHKISRGVVARLFVSCRVRRHARSYLIRIVGVILMICVLTVCIFVIDVTEDLPDLVGHSFMMLLTLTTYSLVVGDILPNLGYLTVLDSIVLISFAFLFFVVLEITFLGRLTYIEDIDPYELHQQSRFFAMLDLVATAVVCIAMSIYVKCVVVAGELRKKHGDPREELDDAMGQPSRTQMVGRFSQSGVHNGVINGVSEPPDK